MKFLKYVFLWVVHIVGVFLSKAIKFIGKCIFYFLMILWELPQNIAGLLIVLVLWKKQGGITRYKKAFHVKLCDIGWGVSLGRFIILPVFDNKDTLKHEYGHCKQSRLLGWLYLLIVGIPSACRNLYFRKHNTDRKGKTYYEAFPENWADELGKVYRYKK